MLVRRAVKSSYVVTADHKARVSLRSVLHNQRLPLNVKTFRWVGEGGRNGSSGLLNIYCSFITLFRIFHSLYFPNGHLVSEVSGAPASGWYSGGIVSPRGCHPWSYSWRADSKSLLGSSSLLGEWRSEMLWPCSQCIQTALYLLPQFFPSPFSIPKAADFQAPHFAIVVIDPSLTSANPFFLIPTRNQMLPIRSSKLGESLLFVHLENWKLKTTF